MGWQKINTALGAAFRCTVILPLISCTLLPSYVSCTAACWLRFFAAVSVTDAAVSLGANTEAEECI
ncbi:hypothetical protein R70723_05340 [Paenibacillus sp. FSL R7-0273]|nr:hypothetical protein R70723_05340 [Paenibacillus sp. FSL R7-0273]OMF89988.1 hypothetical protein BK144_18550 [Paenibacillus sp. FSL R7-0273]